MKPDFLPIAKATKDAIEKITNANAQKLVGFDVSNGVETTVIGLYENGVFTVTDIEVADKKQPVKTTIEDNNLPHWSELEIRQLLEGDNCPREFEGLRAKYKISDKE